MDTQNPEAAPENPGAPNPEAKKADIVPIAAVRLDQAPNREQRNRFYTELGSLKMPEGLVRLYANRRDGSMLAVMPDHTAFAVNTALFGTQCYKYWKLHPDPNQILLEEEEEDTTPSTPDPMTLREAADLIPRTLLDAQGNPIAKS